MRLAKEQKALTDKVKVLQKEDTEECSNCFEAKQLLVKKIEKCKAVLSFGVQKGVQHPRNSVGRIGETGIVHNRDQILSFVLERKRWYIQPKTARIQLEIIAYG